MRSIILCSAILLLCSCAAKDRQLRLIFVENPNETRFYSLKGEQCILSGQDVDPQVYKGDGYPKEVKILETYKNCDFHRVRILNEREKLYWGIDYRYIEQERLNKQKRNR